MPQRGFSVCIKIRNVCRVNSGRFVRDSMVRFITRWNDIHSGYLKSPPFPKNLALTEGHMYKFEGYRQLGLADFNQPAGLKMDPENCWVKKAAAIFWEAIEEKYAELSFRYADRLQLRVWDMKKNNVIW